LACATLNPSTSKLLWEWESLSAFRTNYNVLSRAQEEVLKLCEQHSITFIPYWPTGGNQENGIADAVLSELGDKYQATPRQIGLAWLLAHSAVTLPIPGTSSVRHLDENIAATAIRRTSEDEVRLDGLAGQ
jgi:pyridoxine 4-dehydrogenase